MRSSRSTPTAGPLPSDDDQLVALPAWYVSGRSFDRPWVDHAYAITGHKTQALTSDDFSVHPSTRADAQWAYVTAAGGRGGDGAVLRLAGLVAVPGGAADLGQDAADRGRSIDLTLRRFGGAPTCGLTDNEKTVTVEHVAGIVVRNPRSSRSAGITA